MTNLIGLIVGAATTIVSCYAISFIRHHFAKTAVQYRLADAVKWIIVTVYIIFAVCIVADGSSGLVN